MPVGVAKSNVVSRFVEEVDPNEPAPPAEIPDVPILDNRRDTQMFSSSAIERSTSLADESVETVSDI